MKKAIQLNIKGIKCDNKNCDYKNENVLVEEYKDWLNKSCPKCGENLLTQVDYDNIQMLIALSGIINDIIPEEKNDQEKIRAIVEMDGSGKMNFKL